MNAMHITTESAKHTNRDIHGNKFGANIEVRGKINNNPAIFNVTFWKDKPGQISIEAAYEIRNEPPRFQCVRLTPRDRAALIEFARPAIED